MKKRAMLFLCILSCVLMVSGCSLVRQNKNFDKKELEKQTDEFLQTWFSVDFNQMIATYQTQLDENTMGIYQNYAKLQKKYKGIKKKLRTEYTITTDSATVTETVLCKNGQKIVISLSFDKDGNIQQDAKEGYALKFDQYKTLGQKMGKAGLNTIMSMAIVFVVLIFIAWIISGFKLLDKMDFTSPKPATIAPKNPSGNTVSKNTQSVSKTGGSKSADASEDLMDDLELVAVITAAIAAAAGAQSTDGLVVRSIIRRS